jgi:chemotaxis protein MotB
VYRRVRKVLHPLTKEYLGFVMIRLAIVKVTDISPTLTTVESVVSYGPITPGDPVMRFVPPPVRDIGQRMEAAEVGGMIVELQADRPMTMVSQSNVVYVDRGNEHGLKAGDLMDILRPSAGLPVRKIGQLKVLSTEERTATARIIKANTRIYKGDRLKLVGYSEPVIQPVETAPPSAKTEQPVQEAAVPTDLVASKLKMQEASGQSRINLGDLANFLRYESGEAAIRPEGYKVLDQLIEHLLTSGDTRLIRVEGHTDNVEIGPSLKARYPSNLDLSKARAGSVVRYLIEKGGLDSARLSSVGYGDSRPAATNANEEGRSKNRRVELVLYEPETEPQAPPSNADNQTQKQEGDPSVLNARETNSQLAAPPDSSPTSGSGTLSTSEQRKEDASVKRSETLDGPDASGAMSSGSEQKASGTAGDGPTVQNSPPASDAPSQEAGKQSDTPLLGGSPGL